jgi:hypothetical protein
MDFRLDMSMIQDHVTARRNRHRPQAAAPPVTSGQLGLALFVVATAQLMLALRRGAPLVRQFATGLGGITHAP